MLENHVIVQHAPAPAESADAVVAAWLAVLSASHAERLGRLPDRRAQLESLLGLALLASAAAAAGCPRPDWSALDFGAGARPRWPGGPAFSISHAGGRVACAIAPSAATIGLDIEWRHAVAPADLRLVADAEERAAMAGGRLGAAELWVGKEAVLKAAGLGVRHAAAVRIAPPTGWIGSHGYALQWLELVPGLAAAVASDPPATLLAVSAVEGAALLAAGP